MGWTSKREQDIEKWREGLSNLKKLSNSIEQSIEKREIEKAKEQIKTLKKEVDHYYIQAKDFVEMLTDPNIEIPIELKMIIEECDRLREEIKGLKTKYEKLDNKLLKEKEDYKKLNKECKQLRRKKELHDYLCSTNEEYKSIYMSAYLNQAPNVHKEDLEAEE